MSDRNPQTQDKFVVRLPDGMRERLKAMAAERHRSMNAEIVAAIESAIETHQMESVLAESAEKYYSEMPGDGDVDIVEVPTQSDPVSREDIREWIDEAVREAMAHLQHARGDG